MNSPSSGQHTATIRLVKIAFLSNNSSRRRAKKIAEPATGAGAKRERDGNHDDSPQHTDEPPLNDAIPF